MSYIPTTEFYEQGYLQELNRLFLHPLGLALEVDVHPDGRATLTGVQDHRNTGIRFADQMLETESAQRKAQFVAEQRRERRDQLMEAHDGQTFQPMPDDPHADLDSLMVRSGRWRTEVVEYRENMMPPSVPAILSKAAEELGEVARAAIGDLEGRPDRGDVLHEVAQTILVLMTLLGIHYPGSDLLSVIQDEMEDLERALEMMRLLAVLDHTSPSA